MSRIMEAWDAVLRDAVSSDFDERQFALFQIGLVLQRHNPHVVPDSDVYEDSLSRELLRLTLNEQRQQDAVEYLAALATKKSQQAGDIIFAMAQAQPQILIKPMVGLLTNHGKQFNKTTAYQAALAVGDLVKHGEDEIQAQLTTDAILDLLESWADHNDALLADKAVSLLDKLDPIDDEDLDNDEDD